MIEHHIVKSIKKQLMLSFKKTKWDHFETVLNYINDIVIEFLKKQESSYRNTVYSQPNMELVIFGCGDGGRKLLQQYNTLGINVKFFCDNDPAKQHTVIDNIYVIKPEEINKNYYVIVASTYASDISSQLHSLNIPHTIVCMEELHLEIKANELLSQIKFFQENLNDLRKTYQLFEDERSKFVYLNLLKTKFGSFFYISNEFYKNICEGNQYWALSQFRVSKDDIYIDAGACMGDTIESLIYNNGIKFNKIYAFEASPKIYQKLKYTVDEIIKDFDLDENAIECVPKGLGNTAAALELHCSDTNCGSNTFSEEVLRVHGKNITWQWTEQIEVCRLDEYLKDIPITFIKADIEGMELDMLKGGEKLIKKYRPKLTICLYHKPKDIFEIPLYIHSLVPEYKMAIRHHAPIHTETVLYCWI